MSQCKVEATISDKNVVTVTLSKKDDSGFKAEGSEFTLTYVSGGKTANVTGSKNAANNIVFTFTATANVTSMTITK